MSLSAAYCHNLIYVNTSSLQDHTNGTYPSNQMESTTNSIASLTPEEGQGNFSEMVGKPPHKQTHTISWENKGADKLPTHDQ